MLVATCVDGQLKGDDFTLLFIEIRETVFYCTISKTVAVIAAVGKWGCE